jgi:hypothetical protein
VPQNIGPAAKKPGKSPPQAKARRGRGSWPLAVGRGVLLPQATLYKECCLKEMKNSPGRPLGGNGRNFGRQKNKKQKREKPHFYLLVGKRTGNILYIMLPDVLPILPGGADALTFNQLMVP